MCTDRGEGAKCFKTASRNFAAPSRSLLKLALETALLNLQIPQRLLDRG
jgi:hypothetical protein